MMGYLILAFIVSTIGVLHLVATLQTSQYTKDCREILRQLRDNRG